MKEMSNFLSIEEWKEIEGSCLNFEWAINSFDELTSMSSLQAAFAETMNDHTKLHLPMPDTLDNRPMKLLKTSSWSSSSTTTDHIPMKPQQLDSPNLLPRAKSKDPKQTGIEIVKAKGENACPESTSPKGISTSRKRQPPAQEHIIAERKRREKLGQSFIALSALIPGLKRMDKLSIIGDAINHMKQLKERVKTLEEEEKEHTKKKGNTPSVDMGKKYKLLIADGGENNSSSSSCSSSCLSDDEEQLPQIDIEARFSQKDVLIRIHCQKRTGIMERALAEVEKLRLSVISSHSIAFASHALDITVMAKMDDEFNMTVKELVKALHSVLKQFCI